MPARKIPATAYSSASGLSMLGILVSLAIILFIFLYLFKTDPEGKINRIQQAKSKTTASACRQNIATARRLVQIWKIDHPDQEFDFETLPPSCYCPEGGRYEFDAAAEIRCGFEDHRDY